MRCHKLWDTGSLSNLVAAKLPMHGFCCSPRHLQLLTDLVPHLFLETVQVRVSIYVAVRIARKLHSPLNEFFRTRLRHV